MDKNNSLERRFSLSTSTIPQPIAESTCLNGTANSTSQAIFQWGMSPKNRSSSLLNLQNNQYNDMKSKRISNRNMSITSPHRYKIDPRTYADVHSKGLASRIVKYHENGTRLNRSMSMNNLYNKPGQFPVVHLKKTELAYKANKQSPSMTRIAPPKNSMFYGNTLSSLLRSNSIVGLHKSDEEISRENRPILHPPPTELAPTRSVLEVLKEISRKRINSDDLETSDVSKKHCNRDNNNDVVDLNSNPSANISINGRDAINSSINLTPNYKRQRMHSPPQQQQQQQQAQTPSNLVYLPQHPSTKVATVDSDLSRLSNQQCSPEQAKKKRLCSYNNDITSSLSSSFFQSNKRKLYAKRSNTSTISSTSSTSPNNSRSSASGEDDVETLCHKTKIQRQNGHQLRLDNSIQSMQNSKPITPEPPQNAEQHKNLVENKLIVDKQMPPNQSVSEAIISHRNQISPPTKALSTATISRTTQPKLTLFNKHYTNDDTTSTNDADNNDIYADIQFVKPKRSTSISNSTNPIIQRTQKSKLALMLCGLRGELYHGDDDDDEVDVSDTSRSNAISGVLNTSTIANNEDSFKKPELPATTVAITSATVTTNVLSTKTTPTITFGATSPSSDSNAAATQPTTTIESSSNGFHLSPPQGGTTTSLTSTNPTTTAASITPTTTTTTTSFAIPTAISKEKSPLVGIKLTPQSSVTSPVPSTTTTFAFGTQSNVSNSTAFGTANPIATNTPVMPKLGGFTSNTITATAANTTSDFAGFAATSQSNTVIKPAFTFGSPTTTTIAATISGNTIAATTAGFTFGDKLATTTASTVLTTSSSTTVAPPVFSFGTPATTATVFGKSEEEKSTARNLFGPPTPATTSSTSLFGTSATSNIQTATDDSKFIFGNTTTAATPTATQATPTATFSFTATSSSNPPTTTVTTGFTFGASKFGTGSATSAQQAASTTTNNLFAFGAVTSTQTSTNTTTTTSSTAATGNSFGFGSENTGSSFATANGFAGFGTSATNSPKPSVASGPFSFGGGVTNTTTKTSTASSTLVPSNLFSFSGAAATNSNNTTNANAATGGNTFGTFGTTQNSTETPNAATSLFGNNANSSNSNSNSNNNNTNAATRQSGSGFGGGIFGGNSVAEKPQQAVTAFGATGNNNANATNSNSNTQLFSFGAANNQASTNVNSAGSGFSFSNAAAATTTAGSTFPSSSSSSNSSSNNIFGNSAANVNANSISSGIVKPNFSFNAGSSNLNAAAPTDNSKNLFGGAAAATSNTNTFGSLAAAATGANSNQNKPFTFGNKIQTNIFGSNTALNSNTNPNNSNNNNNNQNVSNLFSFGSTNTINNNKPAATFSFTTTNNNTNPNNNNNSNNVNNLSSSTSSIFNGVGQQQQQQQQPFAFAAPNISLTTQNLFAPTPINSLQSQSTERPIRRATRRLQKQ